MTLSLVPSGADNPSGATADMGELLAGDLDLRAELARDILRESRGRVLVVETDPQKAVSQAMEEAGFSVHATDDGVIATQMLASSKFDAVISDVTARSMGGLELLRFVKEQHTDMPVLLMTGAPDVETASQAVEHGAFQYLLKPIPNDRLMMALDKAVKAGALGRARTDALRAMEDVATIDTSNEGASSATGHVAQAMAHRAQWNRALDKLWMAYQPIVLPGGKLYAYEALVRSDEPSLRGPGDLLDMAEKLGALHELGRAVRARAGKFAMDRSGENYVFVNLHAEDLLDDQLLSRAELIAQVAPAVVLEITERAAVHDIEDAKARMTALRSMGFRIALDDLGAGYAGLTTFAELRPDIVKLDMALVRNVDKDIVKRKLIRSITEVSNDMGALVVGEGVETENEREALIDLGCHLLQGYLFGKPQPL